MNKCSPKKRFLTGKIKKRFFIFIVFIFIVLHAQHTHNTHTTHTHTHTHTHFHGAGVEWLTSLDKDLYIFFLFGITDKRQR